MFPGPRSSCCTTGGSQHTSATADDATATHLSCAKPVRQASTTTMTAATANHRDRRERDADMTLHNERADTNCGRERPEITIGRGPRQAHEREQRQHDHIRVPRIDEKPRAERSCEEQDDEQAERQSCEPSASPQHHADTPDRDSIDSQRAGKNSEPLPAQQPVRHGEHVEQQRARVVPPVARVRTEKGRVAGADISCPQLDRRPIRRRQPAAAENPDQQHEHGHGQ